MADQRHREPHQAQADAALLHDQAGPDEERQCQQDEVAGAVEGVLRHRDQRRHAADQEEHQRTQQHRKTDGKPEQNRQQEGDQHDAKCRAVTEMKRWHDADGVNDADQQRHHAGRQNDGARRMVVDQTLDGKQRDQHQAHRQRQDQPRRIDFENRRVRGCRNRQQVERHISDRHGGNQNQQVDSDRKGGSPSRR